MTHAWIAALALYATPIAPPAAGSQPPDACKLIVPNDVKTALGPGFATGPSTELTNTSEMSSCLYRKDARTTVAITVLAGPNRNGKAAVLGRQSGYQTAGRPVAPLAGLCEAAFSVVITPASAFVVAGKGAWQMDIQVVVRGRPNVATAQALAKAACGRLH